MKIGLMWFDPDIKKSFEDKILEGITYRDKKYHTSSDLVFVHPSMLPEIDPLIPGVQIKTHPAIRPHHFWIGSTNS